MKLGTITRFCHDDYHTVSYWTADDPSLPDKGTCINHKIYDNVAVCYEDHSDLDLDLTISDMTGIAPQGGCLDFLTYEYLEKQEMEKAFVLAGATGEVGTIRSFLTLLKETYLLGTYIDRCLINAANNGHLHIIEFFHNTLYPKPFYMYDRLLIDATQNNHQNVVNFLLQQNTSMSHESYRAFRYAVRYRYHEIVKTFLANGLDPNILYGIALNEASVNCDLPLVKILVEAGADVNAGKYKAEDIRSETALETAARKRCIDLVKYLVEHGAAITNRALEGTDLDIAYYLVSKRDKLY